MTRAERATIYLCIIDALEAAGLGNEPAESWKCKMEAMTDERLVAFHNQIRQGEKPE